jgi:acyl-[acyl carrier protein]--UDP-N-acetylglucosamine O-acyltransferase
MIALDILTDGFFAAVAGIGFGAISDPPLRAFKMIAYSGINIIGLRRRGFSNELIENIHNTYRIIYNSGKNVSDALQQIREEVPMTPEIEYIVSFIENSGRGIIR